MGVDASQREEEDEEEGLVEGSEVGEGRRPLLGEHVHEGGEAQPPPMPPSKLIN